MTHQKRYTAEDIQEVGETIVRNGGPNVRSLAANMLRQAAHTESQVAGLVDDADAVLDSAKVIEINFQPSDYYSVPKKYLDALHEATSKFKSKEQ